MGAGNGAGIGMNNYNQMNMGNYISNPNQFYMNWMMNYFQKMNRQLLMMAKMQNNFKNFGVNGGNQYVAPTTILPKNMEGFC